MLRHVAGLHTGRRTQSYLQEDSSDVLDRGPDPPPRDGGGRFREGNTLGRVQTLRAVNILKILNATRQQRVFAGGR